MTVGAADDVYEREADAMADSVLRQLSMPAGSNGSASVPFGRSPNQSRIRRMECSRNATDSFTAPAEVESRITGLRGRGAPMESSVRSSFENAMGVDLGAVRVHHDSTADQLNRTVSAKAFTTGNDVFFSKGTYSPGTRGGQRLLAHELTHTVQQSGIAQRSPVQRIRLAQHARLQREDVDSRGSSWKGVDAEASEKRLAHAKEEYLFEKSLSSGGDAEEATNARLASQKEAVSSENDVGVLPPVFLFLYKRNAALAIEQFGYTKNQEATIRARLKDRENIPQPQELLPTSKIAAHLGKFANGAHAFIDPTASKKIEDEITDTRFKGWGIDANFVAPLDEANSLNAKAHKERGIETIEDELGIPSKYWSKSAWNPAKELVRWVIPKPKFDIDAEGAGVLLEMATGRESGADPALWVAGGLTKGGASEAVLKAIPREQLMKFLAEGTIKQKIERYPETRDNIT